MEAGPEIVASNQHEPQRQLAIYLGSLKTIEGHRLLKQMAYSGGPVAEQARSSLLSNPEPDDLPELAALIFQAGKDSDQYGSHLSELPHSLMFAFGNKAVPIVERALTDSPYIWVRTAAAEELSRKNDPAAFRFFLDAIVNNRWSSNDAYKSELIQFLKGNFPSQVPQTADEGVVTSFLQKRLASE
jgi:hypothetical protein